MTETRYPLDVIAPLADHLLRLLTPACERIEIAGSIRRGKSTVKDIELVAVAKPARPVFGQRPLHDALDARLRDLELSGRVCLTNPLGDTRYGPRYRQFWLLSDNGGASIPVDLFVVAPPAQWGAIFAIRTGPNDWNEYIMRRVLPFRGLRQVDGHLETAHGELVETPEEAHWFDALGLPYIPPEHRSVGALKQLAAAHQRGVAL